ncbi:MAG TPA: hypothetical protein PLO56_04810 [Rhodothermales bacterium]|nr:hypothetical protein [Rhodothermales bacterium]
MKKINSFPMKFSFLILFVLLSLNVVAAQSNKKQKTQTMDNKIPRFKAIELNTRNGGFGLLTEDGKQIYYGQFHYVYMNIQKFESPLSHANSFFGESFYYPEGNLSTLTNGIVPVPVEELRKSKHIFKDREGTRQYWYIGQDNFIHPYGSNANIPPKKEAVRFTVYDGDFFMIDNKNNLWRWKKGDANWKPYFDVQAKFITLDHGISTPLIFIGMDDFIYAIGQDGQPPYKPFGDIKVRGVAAFGSQFHIVGEDGFYYLRVQDNWVRIDIRPQ